MKRTFAVCAAATMLSVGCATPADVEEANGSLSSELELHSNASGKDATYSTNGFIDLQSEFFQPQGTNGRSCATCHSPEDGWSLRPATVKKLFDSTDGRAPLFNQLDANTPVADLSTLALRRQNFSMLLQGKFVRLRSPPANAEFTVTAANDPFQFGTTARLLTFRRPLATANLRTHPTNWDGSNTVGTDVRAGLERQARGNITGAQQGAPAADEVIHDIVNFEIALSHAQRVVPGVGALDSDGARGGPEHHAVQPHVAGPFDLFDAWANAGNPRRRQIARGQALFNSVNAGSGRSCRGCHNAANDGSNVGGVMFDVGASDPRWAKADMATYTLVNNTTGETVVTTDPGRGLVTGLWSDVNRFKTASLRGVAARAPYFHNGIAETLTDVVAFYEASMGFAFTAQEREDLAAFLSAL